MPELHQLLPGTKVSDWATPGIAASVKPSYAAAYFAGDGSRTEIEKMLLASESMSVISDELSRVRYNLSKDGASNNGVAGYFCGGRTGGANWHDTIDKLLFATDACAVITPTMSIIRYAHAGFANSGTAAYWGGAGWSVDDTIDKTMFSNDSTAVISPTMSVNRGQFAGLADSGTAGYWGGGRTDLTSIDKTAFSNDTTSALSATFDEGRGSHAGAADSGTAGYWAGRYGYTTPAGSVEKTVFSNDTNAQISATLTYDSWGLAAASNSGVALYWAGGYSDGYVTTINKTVFSNDATSAISSTLSDQLYVGCGLANCGSL